MGACQVGRPGCARDRTFSPRSLNIKGLGEVAQGLQPEFFLVRAREKSPGRQGGEPERAERNGRT